jgi:hypothetical protein
VGWHPAVPGLRRDLHNYDANITKPLLEAC